VKRSTHSKCIGIAVLIATTWIAVLILREQRRPDGLIVGPFLMANNGQFSVTISNASHRKITYQVMQPVFNHNGMWGTPTRVSSVFINGSLIAQSGVLAGTIVHTSRVDRPMHISGRVPTGASAWRLAVVWSYTFASSMEKAHAKVMSLMQRRAFTIQPQDYTNYSGAIGL